MIATHVCPDRTLLCTPLGVLDWSTSIALREIVDNASGGGSDILIDLSQVQRVDASGLTAIFNYLRAARTAGGKIEVINPQPQVSRWIDILSVPGVTNAPARAGGNAAAGPPEAKRTARAAGRPLPFGRPLGRLAATRT